MQLGGRGDVASREDGGRGDEEGSFHWWPDASQAAGKMGVIAAAVVVER